jgi:hypothetical protein
MSPNMDDDLLHRFDRWHEADAVGRDDEADGACRALFAAASGPVPVTPDFTRATLAAIEAAAARDRARSRRVRRTAGAVAVVGTVGGLYAGGGWLLGSLSAVFLGLLDLLITVTVRVAASVHTGADAWTLLASLGRATAAFVSEPAVTVVMLGLQGVAMAALIALQRLLGSDRESFK